MLKLSYMAVIAFIILGSFWLEIVLKVRVLARFKRAVFAIAPVAFLFVLWDRYAISHGHWSFDEKQILGFYGPFGIPVEEYFFFLFVPIAAIMSFEAVRSVKKHWIVGDEK